MDIFIFLSTFVVIPEIASYFLHLIQGAQARKLRQGRGTVIRRAPGVGVSGTATPGVPSPLVPWEPPEGAGSDAGPQVTWDGVATK